MGRPAKQVLTVIITHLSDSWKEIVKVNAQTCHRSINSLLVDSFMICYTKKQEVILMGMTNRQFQGFIRLTIAQLEEALNASPENEKLKQLLNIFRSMLEDGTD